MKMMKLALDKIKPYENNPRKNDDAVNAVAESIRQCSYITPIIVDENYVIIAGHTRYKALIALNVEEADVLVCSHLSEEDKKKYRFLDNKTGEKATWDFLKLEAELKDLDLPKLKMEFNFPLIPFKDVREPYGKEMSEDSLVKKFLEYRKPTDRCIADISQRLRKKVAGFTNPINWDNEPVQTVVSGGNMYRGCDGLMMTDRDIINCQTFPQDYDFMDQKVQYVCGMSVPPVMMANISKRVYEQWLK